MNRDKLATGTILLAVLVYCSILTQQIPQSTSTHVPESAPPFLSASFTYSPTSPTVGETVSFTGQAVGVPPFTFGWDMGDGTTNSSQQTVYHAYSQPGTFQVTMTVTDGLNQTTSSIQPVTVSNPQPPTSIIADFSYSPISPVTGDTVTFTAQASGGAPGGYLYSWDIAGVGASGQTTTYTFKQPGAYTVTLTVVDSLGVTGTVSHQVNVSQPAPHPSPFSVAITARSDSPEILENVTFTVTITGGTGPYMVQWDFGDNHTAQGNQAVHSYRLQGKYTIILTATDSTGASVSATKLLTVTGPQPKSRGIYPGLSNEELAGLIVACTGIAFGYTIFSVRSFRRQQQFRRQRHDANGSLSSNFTRFSERETGKIDR